MTNSELIQNLVMELQKQGKEPSYIVGYLQSFLTQVVSGASSKYQSQVHSDLVWHLNCLQKVLDNKHILGHNRYI